MPCSTAIYRVTASLFSFVAFSLIIMEQIDLSGIWSLSLPPHSTQENGEPPNIAYRDQIKLPGSLQEQGYGDPATLDTEWTTQIVGNSWVTDARYSAHLRRGELRMPFWLQPERHYTGAAWYQRDIEIPSSWAGKRILLHLERPHIRTTVWIDSSKIGSQDTLAAPHLYDMGTSLAIGKHTLTICVDNRLHLDMGANSHSVTDHTQTNWNGIVGDLHMKAVSPVWIEDIQVFPQIASRHLRVEIRIGNSGGKAGSGTLNIEDDTHQISWSEADSSFTFFHPIPAEAKLWDEFHPNLHQLSITLLGDQADHQRSITYGLRELGVEGTQMTINGRKIFLRGTVECAVFPKTAYPPTNVAEWKKIFDTCQSYGLNHVRFHSWCPPEAAFQAADALGVYLQVECSSWAQFSTVLGQGKPVDEWLYREGHEIIRAYGNHPSFTFMAYGNEPGGNFVDYLSRWVDYWRKTEPRRLHTGGAGWPSLPQNDFDNIPEPRIQQWAEESRNRLDSLAPSTTADYRFFVDHTPRPIVSHEVGERCVYPDFSEIPKYTGYLKAKNFETFRETLEENHMGDQAADFLSASGKLQILCYREEIESALRTKGFGGYQILQANDFPGQGTALVGWLNPFWESKGYVTPEEFRKFNAPTVILARLQKRIFLLDDLLEANIEIAHFGPQPIWGRAIHWCLRDTDGHIYRKGEFPKMDIPIGNGIQLGRIVTPLDVLAAPLKYQLEITIEGTDIENSWDLWIYPRQGIALPTESIQVTDSLGIAMEATARGDTVLFIPPKQKISGDVGLGFSSIFWNTAWTSQQLPHTLGLLCDPSHPAFAQFPTEFHTNWQWWELFDRGSALVMNELPPKLRPIVQIIDDWFTNRRLGLLFEARIGNGKIVVCGMDLLYGLYLRPAASQFRHSLLNYMAGDKFNPAHEIDESALRSLLKP